MELLLDMVKNGIITNFDTIFKLKRKFGQMLHTGPLSYNHSSYIRLLPSISLEANGGGSITTVLHFQNKSLWSEYNKIFPPMQYNSSVGQICLNPGSFWRPWRLQAHQSNSRSKADASAGAETLQWAAECISGAQTETREALCTQRATRPVLAKVHIYISEGESDWAQESKVKACITAEVAVIMS